MSRTLYVELIKGKVKCIYDLSDAQRTTLKRILNEPGSITPKE